MLKQSRLQPIAVVALLCLTVLACKQAEPPAPTVTETAVPRTLQREDLKVFAPLPDTFGDPAHPPSDAQVALGQMLFHDTRLSLAQDISCDTCHDLQRFGVDARPTSPGHRGQFGSRNSPTVLNAAGQFVQFWDGRAKDVEEQAKGPILNPVEMAMASSETVVASLRAVPGYVQAFHDAFPSEADPLTYDNLGRAVGAFERKLVAKSRWDKFLAGDDAALTDVEKAGALTFVQTGCTACHNGVLVGGGMFQKAGLVKPWPNQKDTGRLGVTKKTEDTMVFKVPSLRNVAKTAPYFHDGSVAALPEAIRLMAEHQLGKQLDDAQTASIAAFLGALTGEVAPALSATPTLPPSVAPAR